jgi:hypothetical protein
MQLKLKLLEKHKHQKKQQTTSKKSLLRETQIPKKQLSQNKNVQKGNTKIIITKCNHIKKKIAQYQSDGKNLKL